MRGDIPELRRGDRLTEHFKVEEFCRAQDPIPPAWMDRALRLALVLESVRGFIGRKRRLVHPVIVLSGYRSREHNEKVPGAAKQSQHMFMRAADFLVANDDPDEADSLTLAAHDYLLDNADVLGVGGLGWYPPPEGSPRRARVHVDLRWRRPGDPVVRWVVKK